MQNKKDTKIFIAADHRGVGLKLYLIEMLTAAGYSVVNLGTDDTKTMVDFPDVAEWVATEMLNDPSPFGAEAGKTTRGILICGSGAGVTIAANRYRHIRATRCDRPEMAREDRFHDDVNVLTLAADDIDPEVAFLTATAFLESPFDAIERRIRRLEKIS
ncbi:MAG: RpiB/LacA/LacB family sugar-phosphate isomerase [Rickettsiales bacterium]|jgi:ribose 5-phosphate isomerase B|nr:RpiB/LacA/LacB family sugar-phosphate isomerase [Rickettsiales bacterium]